MTKRGSGAAHQGRCGPLEVIHDFLEGAGGEHEGVTLAAEHRSPGPQHSSPVQLNLSIFEVRSGVTASAFRDKIAQETAQHEHLRGVKWNNCQWFQGHDGLLSWKDNQYEAREEDVASV